LRRHPARDRQIRPLRPFQPHRNPKSEKYLAADHQTQMHRKRHRPAAFLHSLGHLRSFVCRNLDVRFLFSLPTFAASTVNDPFWLQAAEIAAAPKRLLHF
jgi:hypothetical protein